MCFIALALKKILKLTISGRSLCIHTVKDLSALFPSLFLFVVFCFVFCGGCFCLREQTEVPYISIYTCVCFAL